MSPTDMILALRKEGISSADIARWGKKKGRQFTSHAITSIVHRQSQRISPLIAATLQELYERLCN